MRNSLAQLFHTRQLSPSPPPQTPLRRGARLRLLAVRKDVRPSAPVQAAPAEPQEEAVLLVHGVREELPVFIPPQHTPPDAHGREAVRLRAVREEVHAAEQPEGPPAHAQRGAALQLLAVRENLHPDAPFEAAQNHSHIQLRGRCPRSGERTQMTLKTKSKSQ